MNKNTYFYDMLNQYSSEQNIEANNNNYDLLNNLKYQSSQNLFSRLYGPSYNYSSISLNNLNFFSKTESDIEKEKVIKNDNNNINNNDAPNKNVELNNNLYNTDNNLNKYNSLKNSQFNVPSNENNINKNLSYGDYFLNASINYEKNNLIQNKLNLNEINNNQLLNSQLINNNKINNTDNKNILNYNNNNLNYDFMNYNPNISINNIIINNIEIKNKQNNFENNINNSIKNNSNVKENGKEKEKESDKSKKDDKDMNNNKPKRRRRRRKITNNNKNLIISYGHPKSIIYKTMKQKLNVHKKFDLECRNDSLLFIHSISKLKKIIKQLVSNNKIKEKKLLQELEKLYVNSILSIQHKDYAQDITGFKLI